jgi:hypothetical protein
MKTHMEFCPRCGLVIPGQIIHGQEITYSVCECNPEPEFRGAIDMLDDGEPFDLLEDDD